MLNGEIVVTLPGKAAPKGSLQCIGKRGQVNHQLIEAPRPGQKKWREKIVGTVEANVRQRADQYEAVVVEVTFTLDRGPAHYGTGRNATKLRATAPEWPTRQNTNDVDKMVRLVLDALQDSGLLVDDAQVVEVVGRKTYLLLPPVAFTGPKPPPWMATHFPMPDALTFPGARIRIFGYGGPAAWA